MYGQTEKPKRVIGIIRILRRLGWVAPKQSGSTSQTTTSNLLVNSQPENNTATPADLTPNTRNNPESGSAPQTTTSNSLADARSSDDDSKSVPELKPEQNNVETSPKQTTDVGSTSASIPAAPSSQQQTTPPLPPLVDNPPEKINASTPPPTNITPKTPAKKEVSSASFMFAVMCSNEMKAATAFLLTVSVVAVCLATLAPGVVGLSAVSPLLFGGTIGGVIGLAGLATSCFFKPNLKRREEETTLTNSAKASAACN